MKLNLVLGIIISGVFIFLMLASLILPKFAETYEYGFGTEPCAKTGCTSASSQASFFNAYCKTGTGTTTCTDCNDTTGYSTFLTTCYRLADANVTGQGERLADAYANATYCVPCTDWGFKTSGRGLMLFTFFMIIVAIILVLVKKGIKFK